MDIAFLQLVRSDFVSLPVRQHKPSQKSLALHMWHLRQLPQCFWGLDAASCGLGSARSVEHSDSSFPAVLLSLPCSGVLLMNTARGVNLSSVERVSQGWWFFCYAADSRVSAQAPCLVRDTRRLTPSFSDSMTWLFSWWMSNKLQHQVPALAWIWTNLFKSNFCEFHLFMCMKKTDSFTYLKEFLGIVLYAFHPGSWEGSRDKQISESKLEASFCFWTWSRAFVLWLQLHLDWIIPSPLLIIWPWTWSGTALLAFLCHELVNCTS